MNKKLIAVAVAGALGAPLLAQAQSTVQIYGRLHQAWDSTSTGGVRKDVIANAGGSNIGFKGTESLGGGMNAWFQGEMTMDISNGGSSLSNPTLPTGTAGTTGTTWDRNSGVGLNGSWGGVMFGNWDMPMKWTHVGGIAIEDTGTVGRHALVGGGAPTTVNTRSTAGSFYRRQQNVFQYWSPNFNGFEARVAITSQEERTATCATATAPTAAAAAAATYALTASSGAISAAQGTAAQGCGSPRSWGIGGMYKNGPLQLGLGYERKNDANNFVTGGLGYRSTSDTGWTASGSYTFGGGVFRLGAMYERLTWESLSPVVGDNASRNAWGLYGDWNISGPHNLRMSYTKSGSTSGSYGAAAGAAGGVIAAPSGYFSAYQAVRFNGGAGNTGASMWALSYAYSFSKRTKAKVNYSQINNDGLATYGVAITPGTAFTAVTGGERVSTYGVAIEHSF